MKAAEVEAPSTQAAEPVPATVNTVQVCGEEVGVGEAVGVTEAVMEGVAPMDRVAVGVTVGVAVGDGVGVGEEEKYSVHSRDTDPPPPGVC